MPAHRTSPRRFTALIALIALPTIAASADETCAPVTLIPRDSSPIAVQSWLVCGPFPSAEMRDRDPNGPERAGYDADFLAEIGGEHAARPCSGTTVASPDGRTLTFQPRLFNNSYADLNSVFNAPGEVCAYLYSELESPVDQVAYLHVGTNAPGKAWIGDQLAIAHPHDRVAMQSQNVARVDLRAGRTRLLLKVDHDGGGWGAFAEIYGQSAHRAFVTEKAPRSLALEADAYLPVGGDTVSVRIPNWVPPVDDVSIAWTVIDGDAEYTIPTTAPEVEIPVPPRADRAIRVIARAPHPRGGISLGECAILCGGETAAEQTLDRFEALAPELDGPSRDAYTLALYAVERAQRDVGAANLRRDVAKVGKQAAELRLALDCLEAGDDPYAERIGTFEAAYLSGADGSAQPLAVVVPHSYSSVKPYALFVNLHGASFTHELTGDWAPSAADSAYEDETILISVMGRGRYGGYRGLGEIDVLNAIDWATSHYRIDPDRVYIRGGSMGGEGTWRLASLYPDRFAGAWIDCGSPAVGTIGNLVNLPTWVNHGDEDRSVPVANARLGVDLMRDADCPVTYTEYPGVDHAVGVAVGPEGYMTRLAAHRRVADPRHIRIVADHPRYASMYWGSIEEWRDPHITARLEARVLDGDVVEIATTNVARARVTPPHLSDAGAITFVVNGERHAVQRSTDGAYDIAVSADGVTASAHEECRASAQRPYEPGSTMNLYRGEPLLIVYGTSSPDSTLRAAMRQLGEDASGWLAPESRMEFGSVPLLPDGAVTDDHLRSRNLLLIGGPTDNTVTARLMPQLPIREEAGSLRVFENESIPLAGRGYGFVHPNPLQPDRLMMVYGSQVPAFYTMRRGGSLNWTVREFDPHGADLIVENVAAVDSAGDPRRNQLVRQMWFTHGWNTARVDDQPIGRHPESAYEMASMVAEAYRDAAQAEFTMLNRAEQAGACPYDTSVTGWQDRPVLPEDLIVFDATGRELLELADASAGKWWMLLPAPDAASIDPERSYRVVGTYGAAIWGTRDVRMSPSNARVLDDAERVESALRAIFGVHGP